MILTIILVTLALLWLGKETQWLTICLLITTVAKSFSDRTTDFESVNGLNPVLLANPIYLLPEVCELTRIQREFADTKYKDSWRYGTSYNTRRADSYQTMTIGNHKITLLATLWNLYDLIADVNKAQIEKPRTPTFKPCQLPMDSFIKQVRIGSHNEYVKWNEDTNKLEILSKRVGDAQGSTYLIGRREEYYDFTR